MNGFKRFGMGMVLSLFISACQTLPVQLPSNIGNFIVADAKRSEAIATKYGAPEIATCMQFVETAFTQSNDLISEPTNGLLSFTTKLYLLKKQASGNAAAEQAFKDKCGAVAAGLMLEAAKSAPIPVKP